MMYLLHMKHLNDWSDCKEPELGQTTPFCLDNVQFINNNKNFIKEHNK